MKYLKLFENSNLYKTIDRDVYYEKTGILNYIRPTRKYMDEYYEDFTKPQINTITKLFSKLKNFKVEIGTQYGAGENNKAILNIYYIKYIKSEPSNHFITEIIKTKDEWYYIESTKGIYYQCDEFKGLIDYLNDKLSEIHTIYNIYGTYGRLNITNYIS